MDKINAIVKKLIMNVMILGLGILVSCSKAPDFITVTSPDGKIKLVVDLKDSVSYSIVHEGEVLVSPSALAMKFEGGRMLGVGEASYKVKIGSASESVDAPITDYLIILRYFYSIYIGRLSQFLPATYIPKTMTFKS